MRAANRRALQKRLGLDARRSRTALGVVSRLTWQKGLDLLLAAVPAISRARRAACHARRRRYRLSSRASSRPRRAIPAASRVVVRLRRGARPSHPGRVGRAHRAVALRAVRADPALRLALWRGPVVAPRRRPCRHGDRRQRHGARLGVATGFQFSPVTQEKLEAAVHRATDIYPTPAWQRLQANGMASDVSWRRPAQQYAALYAEIAPAAAKPAAAATTAATCPAGPAAPVTISSLTAGEELPATARSASADAIRLAVQTATAATAVELSKSTEPHVIRTIETNPYSDQRPGTSGLLSIVSDRAVAPTPGGGKHSRWVRVVCDSSTKTWTGGSLTSIFSINLPSIQLFQSLREPRCDPLAA